MKPPKPSNPLRRASVVAAETGIGRDVFLAACRRGELPYELVRLGARGIYYVRERKPAIDALSVYRARRS
ncbi:MAG TPA: hypothetical protein VGE10_05390 [Zeimonas sp.]